MVMVMFRMSTLTCRKFICVCISFGSNFKNSPKEIKLKPWHRMFFSVLKYIMVERVGSIFLLILTIVEGGGETFSVIFFVINFSMVYPLNTAEAVLKTIPVMQGTFQLLVTFSSAQVTDIMGDLDAEIV